MVTEVRKFHTEKYGNVVIYSNYTFVIESEKYERYPKWRVNENNTTVEIDFGHNWRYAGDVRDLKIDKDDRVITQAMIDADQEIKNIQKILLEDSRD